jgi:hypothetical protein
LPYSQICNCRLDYDCIYTLLTSIFRMSYACEVWGLHKAPNNEKTHLHFVEKKVLRVNKRTNSGRVLCELGRYQLYTRRTLRTSNFGEN